MRSPGESRRDRLKPIRFIMRVGGLGTENTPHVGNSLPGAVSDLPFSEATNGEVMPSLIKDIEAAIGANVDAMVASIRALEDMDESVRLLSIEQARHALMTEPAIRGVVSQSVYQRIYPEGLEVLRARLPNRYQ